MKQNAITIVKSIDQNDTRVDDLKEINVKISSGSKDYELTGMKDLHFMSCSIIETVPGRMLLLMELNVDGPTNDFLKKFSQNRLQLILEIFRGCKDLPKDADSARRFLKKGMVSYNVFHTGNTGRSVSRIKQEIKLYDKLSQEKLTKTSQAIDRRDAWCRLKKQLCDDDWAIVQSTPRRPFWVRFNPKAASTRRKFRDTMSLVARISLWILGFMVIVGLDLNSWQYAVILGVPAILTIVRFALAIGKMPKRLRLMPRIRVLGLLAWRAVVSGLRIAAVFGLIYGIYASWVTVWSVLLFVLSGLILLLAIFIAALFSYLLLSGSGLVIVLLAVNAAMWELDASGQLPLSLNQSVIILAVLIIALSLFVFGLLFHLRRQEMKDTVKDADVDEAHLPGSVADREDLQLQNHLISLTRIKGGYFRRGLLKLILRAVNLLARVTENKGYLGNIATIHFGRFVIVEDEYLLFLGNYDGGWGSYLRDFKDSVGLNAIWSQTKGFPRTFFLLMNGAQNERQFKRYARNSQIESAIWYSAYHDLSVAKIDRATETCEDLRRPLDKGGSGLWYDLKRLIYYPMNEADLDAALRRLS